MPPDNEQSDNSANYGGGTGGATIPATEQYSVSLSSSWELDVWGKLTSAKKASYAALLQTEATRRAIQTTLIANVANSYYRLLALDRQLEITEQTVENRRQDVETVKALKEGSVVTGVSVQQSIANQFAAEVTIPELKQQITEQEHALSVLLGRAPGSIERSSLSEQSPIDSLATGMPAQLLRNRPDIIAAEQNFRRAFELTNSARAYFYPSFRLTAEGGYQSLTTEDLFQPGSVFYNLVAGLTQPIFNNGQNKARLKRSKAQQEQAKLQLRSTILDASSEVSNALSRYQNADQKLELRQQQLNALQNAVEYSRELLRYGDATYTEVLAAQQNYLSAQLSNVNDQLQELIAGVDLYRALGGGWDNTANEA
ncbi:MAG: efflux transporter outer membrane subunit [Fodinibius sp.]|nr:efflux transporter outer membrane subunit [Fodinibius sp.]